MKTLFLTLAAIAAFTSLQASDSSKNCCTHPACCESSCCCLTGDCCESGCCDAGCCECCAD